MNKPEPYCDELPSLFADRMALYFSRVSSSQNKRKLGQYFTPPEIASLMASFSLIKGNVFRILDPGCGLMVLSCSITEHIVKTNPDVSSIELVSYETDERLIELAEEVAEYLKKWTKERNISLKYTIVNKDFILENYEVIRENRSMYSSFIEPFDIIISNPPFFKLSKDDLRAKAVKEILNGQPNIYSIFMSISSCLLNVNGELIFIVPRSFSSGNYFRSFREFFFKQLDITRVHLFNSRKEAFSRDNVLQELLIIKGIKKNQKLNYPTITVSSSNGLKDIGKIREKKFEISNLIDFNSKEIMFHLPVSEIDEKVLSIFKLWKGNLNKYNIQISTGPVVAFRTEKHIMDRKDESKSNLAPLIWLHNVNKMKVNWPLFKPKKGQYIRIDSDTISSLIKNKNYILLRRFSSKDDKSRLIAAPYFCNMIDEELIGVENKLNYIYRPKGFLSRVEILGLCALLNSSLFDIHFRGFNGNVNVSATELREMTLPPLDIIEELGTKILITNDFSLLNVDRIVNEFFNITELLNKYDKN